MLNSTKKIRILVTLSAVDVHERGSRYISKKFMEAGFEVIYTRYRRIEEIAVIALQESVDVVGISFFGGNHTEITAEVKKSLADNVLVVVGGDIPEQDYPDIEKIGVDGIFGPGTTAEQAIEFIKMRTQGPDV